MAKSFVNTGNGRPEGDPYNDIISDIASRGVCPFCPEHLHEYHQRPIIHETDNWLLTDNMHPYEGATEHLLVIHRSHIETIAEISQKALDEFSEVIGAAGILRGIKGATLLMRYGDTAFTGASVAHIHAQIVSGPGEPGADPVLARVG